MYETKIEDIQLGSDAFIGKVKISTTYESLRRIWKCRDTLETQHGITFWEPMDGQFATRAELKLKSIFPGLAEIILLQSNQQNPVSSDDRRVSNACHDFCECWTKVHHLSLNSKTSGGRFPRSFDHHAVCRHILHSGQGVSVYDANQ